MSHAIVQAARGWIGTPYVHQASVKGGGTDCLGLVRGIWREFFGAEPEVMPAYTRIGGKPAAKNCCWVVRGVSCAPRRTSSRAMCWSSA